MTDWIAGTAHEQFFSVLPLSIAVDCVVCKCPMPLVCLTTEPLNDDLNV